MRGVRYSSLNTEPPLGGVSEEERDMELKDRLDQLYFSYMKEEVSLTLCRKFYQIYDGVVCKKIAPREQLPLLKSCERLLVRKFGRFFAPQAVFPNLRKRLANSIH